MKLKVLKLLNVMMNNKRFLQYAESIRIPFSQGPDWKNFGVCAWMEVKNNIRDAKERMIKYRRHYGQNLDSPVKVNTYVICPLEWLWPNCWNGHVNDDLESWRETQLMLRTEFPEYKLIFSNTAVHTFRIPGIKKEFEEYIESFWIKIETKDISKTDLGRSVLFSNNLNVSQMEDKVIGTLVGQAVGDALGTRYEFSSSAAATKGVMRDTLPNGHLQMLGGGPFQLLPGQITDDTELALMIARRVPGISKVGLFYIAEAFLDWYLSDPFDIGNATETAFADINREDPIEQIHAKMMANAHYNMDSLSNGCLMKISPIALIGVLPVGNVVYLDKEIADFAADVCKLTNPNPIAQDACRVYVMAIRNAIQGDSRHAIWTKAVQNAETNLVQHLLVNAKERATPAVAKDRDPIMPDGSGQGYLGVALQLAFYELLHGESFEQSLTRTMTRGGDTDTNGCIVGALLGAFYGYRAIPSDWGKKVFSVDNPRVEQLPEVITADLKSLALKLGSKA